MSLQFDLRAVNNSMRPAMTGTNTVPSQTNILLLSPYGDKYIPPYVSGKMMKPKTNRSCAQSGTSSLSHAPLPTTPSQPSALRMLKDIKYRATSMIPSSQVVGVSELPPSAFKPNILQVPTTALEQKDLQFTNEGTNKVDYTGPSLLPPSGPVEQQFFVQPQMVNPENHPQDYHNHTLKLKNNTEREKPARQNTGYANVSSKVLLQQSASHYNTSRKKNGIYST